MEAFPNLGRKYIKSFASGIAFQFACSADHFAWLAWQEGLPVTLVDLISGRIMPEWLEIDRNLNLVQLCHSSLLYSLKRLKPPAMILSAKIEIRFGLTGYQHDSHIPEPGGASYTVILTDDRNKDWQVTHYEKKVLRSP